MQLSTSDWVVILSTLALVAIGIAGYRAWKSQVVGQFKFDTARRLLMEIIQVQIKIDALRSCSQKDKIDGASLLEGMLYPIKFDMAQLFLVFHDDKKMGEALANVGKYQRKLSEVTIDSIDSLLAEVQSSLGTSACMMMKYIDELTEQRRPA